MRHPVPLLFMFAFLAARAGAGELQYSHVEGGGTRGILKGFFDDSLHGAGMAVSGEFEIGPRLFGFGELATHRYNDGPSYLKFMPAALGLGFHAPIGSATDFVAGVSAERESYSGHDGGSWTGWGVRAGLRGRPRKRVEWNAGIRYRDAGSIQSLVGASAGVRYYLIDDLAVGLDVTHQRYDRDTLDASETLLVLAARFDFGRR